MNYEEYAKSKDLIVKAINRWIVIEDGEDVLTINSCVLCKQRVDTREKCKKCPISQYYKNTPFETLVTHTRDVHHMDKIDMYTPNDVCMTCHHLMEDEITFLRNLHPFNIGDKVIVTRNWTDEENMAYYPWWGKTVHVGSQFEGIIDNISLGNCEINGHLYPVCVLEPVNINTEKEIINNTPTKVYWTNQSSPTN